MAIADADINFAKELFAGLGDISTRKMMGGLCLYHQGTIFSIIHGDGRIYLKGAGNFQDVLDAEGLTRWTYQRDGGKKTAMPYWTLPETALDDPEVACDWARRALEHL